MRYRPSQVAEGLRNQVQLALGARPGLVEVIEARGKTFEGEVLEDLRVALGRGSGLLPIGLI